MIAGQSPPDALGARNFGLEFVDELLNLPESNRRVVDFGDWPGDT
jgi:hypothetical protein